MNSTTIQLNPQDCALGANTLDAHIPGLTLSYPRAFSDSQVLRSLSALADTLPRFAVEYGARLMFSAAPLLERVTWRATLDPSRVLLNVSDLTLHPAGSARIMLGDSPYPDEMVRFRPPMPLSSCSNDEDFFDFLAQELDCDKAADLLERLSQVLFLHKADGTYVLERPRRQTARFTRWPEAPGV